MSELKPKSASTASADSRFTKQVAVGVLGQSLGVYMARATRERFGRSTEHTAPLD